ncbi:methyltransferase domain-containing protein [Rheinheimera sp.]|uniref:class I SAM-dependent methyltransferase n=1 Tax=Rheinheimera sp. TaxID=1869214 RepID=UPI00307CD6E0
MKPALSYHSSPLPQSWSELPQGPWMAKAVEQQLNAWWPRIFGYHLLKVGSLSSELDSSLCPIKHQIRLGTDERNSNLLGEPDALPLTEHAVDAVLLAHCLEFYPDPHHIVREAHRVLMPNGYVLLTGYNPLSNAGLLKLWPGVKQQLPWSGRFFTPGRVRDWLHLLGFELIHEQRFFWSGLLGHYKENSGWQRWCERYLGYFGTCYVLIARKREHPLIPIRPKWQKIPSFQPAVKGISARQSSG